MRNSDGVQTVLVLVTGFVLAGAGRALHSSQQSREHWGLDRLLGVGLSALGMVILAAWLLTLTMALVAELLQRHGQHAAAWTAGRCTPAVMRRLAATLLGVNLLAVPTAAQAGSSVPAAGSPSFAAVAGPAEGHRLPADPLPDPRTQAGISPYWSGQAVPAAAGADANPIGSGSAAVSPAWEPMPMPPDGGLMLRAETRPDVESAEVVVAPGDSLWSLAAARLGPLATAAEIAEAWPAWFDANRPTIGDDPCLLIPGQVLHPPSL